MAKKYWLMKSEEDVYSIVDMERDGVIHWEGVRNYEARNLMRDQMKVGDEALFYHSNAKPPGVAGIVRISRRAYPDHFAFVEKSPYFDPKSDPHKPRWLMVDVEFKEAFPKVLPLQVLRDTPELGEMALFKRPRLSVQPVTPEEFRLIRKMARKP
jgi:predicted RNA-binding protein with PUA-like domain